MKKWHVESITHLSGGGNQKLAIPESGQIAFRTNRLLKNTQGKQSVIVNFLRYIIGIFKKLF